jgi:hypothetical protein
VDSLSDVLAGRPIFVAITEVPDEVGVPDSESPLPSLNWLGLCPLRKTSTSPLDFLAVTISVISTYKPLKKLWPLVFVYMHRHGAMKTYIRNPIRIPTFRHL